MSFQLEFRDEPGFLVVDIAGMWSEGAVRQAIDAIRDEALARGFYRVLIDVTGTVPGPDTMLRFYAGERIAIGFRSLRVAAIGPREWITRVAETVAVNRGAVFSVFSERDVALRWLLDGSGAPGARDRG